MKNIRGSPERGKQLNGTMYNSQKASAKACNINQSLSDSLPIIPEPKPDTKKQCANVAPANVWFAKQITADSGDSSLAQKFLGLIDSSFILYMLSNPSELIVFLHSCHYECEASSFQFMYAIDTVMELHWPARYKNSGCY